MASSFDHTACPLRRMDNPSNATTDLAPDFPIRVNESALTVTVAAGITQRALLDYLAAFQCQILPLPLMSIMAPSGCPFPSQPARMVRAGKEHAASMSPCVLEGPCCMHAGLRRSRASLLPA